jgi:predicted DNA-binding protein with PD1-like motif
MQDSVKPGRIVMGRLKKGDDLLGALQQICSGQEIRLGDIRALGAVKNARIGYYYQDGREYNFVDLAQHLELLALVGNVSIKDGKPFLHAHVTFANSQGQAFGGHLAQGTEVFACEYTITEYLSNAPFERVHDDETGLALWKQG